MICRSLLSFTTCLTLHTHKDPLPCGSQGHCSRLCHWPLFSELAAWTQLCLIGKPSSLDAGTVGVGGFLSTALPSYQCFSCLSQSRARLISSKNPSSLGSGLFRGTLLYMHSPNRMCVGHGWEGDLLVDDLKSVGVLVRILQETLA